MFCKSTIVLKLVILFLHKVEPRGSRILNNTTTLEVDSDAEQERVAPLGNLWPNAVVPYVIEPSLPANQLINFQSAIARISAGSCVIFRPAITAVDNYWLKVYYDPARLCQATLGWQNNKGTSQFISLKPSCSPGSVVHELLHTLGFDHEQNRDDRDDFVNIHFNDNSLWDNSTGRIDQFKKQYRKTSEALGKPTTTYGLPYNFESIMHYGPWFGAKDGDTEVMTVKPDYPRNKAVGDPANMGQREEITPTDRQMINKRYCSGVAEQDPAQPENPDYIEYPEYPTYPEYTEYLYPEY